MSAPADWMQNILDSINGGGDQAGVGTNIGTGGGGETPSGSIPFTPTPTSGAGQMGPPDLRGSNFVPNGDGTYTDTSTGIMYDANGISLGNDPSLTGALDSSGTSGSGMPNLSQLLGLGGGGNGLAALAGLLAPALAGLYSANK